jgi:hypothetical protein
MDGKLWHSFCRSTTCCCSLDPCQGQCYRVGDSSYDPEECYQYTVKAFNNQAQVGEESIYVGGC